MQCPTFRYSAVLGGLTYSLRGLQAPHASVPEPIRHHSDRPRPVAGAGEPDLLVGVPDRGRSIVALQSAHGEMSACDILKMLHEGVIDGGSAGCAQHRDRLR